MMDCYELSRYRLKSVWRSELGETTYSFLVKARIKWKPRP